MTDRERQLEDQLRQVRSQVLDLRLANHALESENGDLKRRIRVQAKHMEATKNAAYDVYMSCMNVMKEQYGLE